MELSDTTEVLVNNSVAGEYGCIIGNESDEVTLASDVLSNEPMPEGIAISCLVFGTFTFAVGLVGNFLIILAVIQSPKLRKPYNKYILSFAISDLMILLSVGVFQLHTCHHRKWVFSQDLCVYLSTMLASQLIISGMHIVAISAYRYIRVVHHDLCRYVDHRYTLVSTIFAMYCLSFIFFPLPRLFRVFYLEEPIVKSTFYDTKSMMCIVGDIYRNNLITFIVISAVGSILLFYFYARIHFLVRGNQTRLTNSSGDYSTNGNQTNNRRHSTTKRPNSKDIRILKTMVVIFVMYIGSQTPLPVMLYFDKTRSFPHIAYLPWVMFFWVSSSTNWIIYGALNCDYLRAYRALFHALCSKARLPDSSL